MIRVFLTGTDLAGRQETTRQTGRLVEPTFDANTPYAATGGWNVRSRDPELPALLLRQRTSTALAYDVLSDPRFLPELEFLKAVDVVWYVADSQTARQEANQHGLRALSDLLSRVGRDASRIPMVIQLNKRDLPHIESEADLKRSLRWAGEATHVPTVAIQGRGVRHVLDEVIRLGRLSKV